MDEKTTKKELKPFRKYYATKAKELAAEYYRDDKGLRQGECTTYYQTGVAWKREQYKDNKKHGKCEMYDVHGNLMCITHYKHGRLTGLSIGLDEKGRVVYEGNYRNGYQVGRWTYHVYFN